MSTFCNVIEHLQAEGIEPSQEAIAEMLHEEASCAGVS